MANMYTAEKEINGKKYVAQFNGMSSALDAIDNSYLNDKSDRVSISKISKYIFEHVIVEPKVTADDFETMEELNEVVRFGMDVMQGKFRPEKKDTKATK